MKLKLKCQACGVPESKNIKIYCGCEGCLQTIIIREASKLIQQEGDRYEEIISKLMLQIKILRGEVTTND